jgi:hypothetical protein
MMITSNIKFKEGFLYGAGFAAKGGCVTLGKRPKEGKR